MESETRAGSGARTRGPKLGKRLGSPRAVLDRTGSSGKLFPRRKGDGPVILQLYMLFKTLDDLTLLLLSLFESPFGRDAGTEPPGVNTLAASRDRLPHHGRRAVRQPRRTIRRLGTDYPALGPDRPALRLRETGGTRCLAELKTNPWRRSPSTLLGACWVERPERLGLNLAPGGSAACAHSGQHYGERTRTVPSCWGVGPDAVLSSTGHRRVPSCPRAQRPNCRTSLATRSPADSDARKQLEEGLGRARKEEGFGLARLPNGFRTRSPRLRGAKTSCPKRTSSGRDLRGAHRAVRA